VPVEHLKQSLALTQKRREAMKLATVGAQAHPAPEPIPRSAGPLPTRHAQTACICLGADLATARVRSPRYAAPRATMSRHAVMSYVDSM
jgi:hypothetical protein